MIKSLLEPDEPESKEKTENLRGESEKDALKLPFQNALKKSEQISAVESLPEKKIAQQPDELDKRLAEIEAMSEAELEKILEGGDFLNEEPYLYSGNKITTENQNPYADVAPAIANPNNREVNLPEVKPKDFAPESQSETIRQTGMAWSAAIALLGSVVFFMIIGWFADLLLGTAPWSLVGGIVIGAVLGFVQFFRISSRIFKPQKSEFERTSLRGD